MQFNPYQYRATENVNFVSMGQKGGNFSIDKKGVSSLYNSISKFELDDFCFVEKKTPYFKLFWDFDISDDLLPKFKKINIPDFWNYMITILLAVLRSFIIAKDNKTFSYIYSDRTDINHKIHLYFPNIVLNSEYCLLLQKEFIRELMEDDRYDLTAEEYNKIIDTSVFKANGIRLLFQKKKNQTGYYTINTKKSTITRIPEDKSQQLTLTSIRSARNSINVELIMDEDQELPLLDILKEKREIKQKIKYETNQLDADPEEIKMMDNYDFDMKIVEQLANNLSEKRIRDYPTWLQFVFLCRNYGWTELAHRISQKVSNYSKNAVNKVLHSKAKGKLFTIGSLLYWSKSDNPKQHFQIVASNDMSQLKTEKIISNEKITFDKYADLVYEENYVQSLDLDQYNTFIIKAATGTGKTEKIIESINNLVQTKKADRITVLASRIILAINIYGRFQQPLVGSTKPLDLQMKLYCDVEEKSKNLQKYKRLIQTPDSLIHMIKPLTNITTVEELNENDDINEDGEYEHNNAMNLDYPDILFVDEIESLLDYVCNSSTLYRNRKEVFTILNEYIINAKYVFMVDSNVTPTVCDYIKNLRNKNKVQVIFNKKKTNDTKYCLTYNEEYFNTKLQEDIKNGKKVFIGSDSKKQTEMLEVQLSNLGAKVKVYNCDTDDESRQALAEVNEEWIKYDVIICSPTILYGVDFNKIHFDQVYGFYTKTINASSIYQQLNRIRKIKDKKGLIYVQDYMNSNVHPMPTKIKDVSKYYFKYKNEFEKIAQLLSVDYTKLYTLNDEDLFTKLYLHYQCEINRCGNNFEKRLTKYITEFGGTLNKILSAGKKSNGF